MSTPTRRGFIAAAGAGAATVTVLATATPAHAHPTSAKTAEEAVEALQGATLVAFVSDPSRGLVTVMVGEDEVQVHDPALVARLTSAARR